MLKELSIILTKLNLISSGDFETYNRLIKKFYQLLKNNSDKIPNQFEQKIINSILFAADDFPFVHNISVENLLESPIFINKLLSKCKIESNDISIQLTPQQHDIFEIMKSPKNKNYIFSMPTSFGKSMLIRLFAEYNISRNRKTIIIAPTISLMNEYHSIFKSKKIKVTSSAHTNENDVYVMTQERALNYEFNSSDVLIIDEAYELGTMSERTGIAYYTIHRALKQNCEIFMFMPNIKNPKKCLRNDSLTTHFIEFYDFKSLSSREITIVPLARKEWFDRYYNILEGQKIIFDTKGNFKKWHDFFDGHVTDISFDHDHEMVLKFLEMEFGSQFNYIKKLRRGIVVSNGVSTAS